MAETSWTEEAGAAPKKRLIPTWAWFCGAGCLIAVILAAIASVFVVRGVKSAMDPEKQWASLAEVLPYDHRPENWKLGFGTPGFFGFEVFVLHNEAQGLVAVVMHLPERDSEETRKKMFDPQHSGGLFGSGGRKEMKRSTVEVQGRELQAMRFYQYAGRSGGAGAEGEQQGETILVDLTPPGAARPLVLQMTREGSGEPITDQEVVDFLEPFHVDGR
jgi:hypothetical protein